MVAATIENGPRSTNPVFRFAPCPLPFTSASFHVKMFGASRFEKKAKNVARKRHATGETRSKKRPTRTSRSGDATAVAPEGQSRLLRVRPVDTTAVIVRGTCLEEHPRHRHSVVRRHVEMALVQKLEDPPG